MLTLRGFLKLGAFLVALIAVPLGALYLWSLPPSGAPDDLALDSVTVLAKADEQSASDTARLNDVTYPLIRVTFMSAIDLQTYAYRNQFMIDREVRSCVNGAPHESERVMRLPNVYDRMGIITENSRTYATLETESGPHVVSNPRPVTSGPPDEAGRFRYRVYFPLRTGGEEPKFRYDLQARPQNICLYLWNRVKLAGPSFRSNTVVIPHAAFSAAMQEAALR